MNLSKIIAMSSLAVLLVACGKSGAVQARRRAQRGGTGC